MAHNPQLSEVSIGVSTRYRQHYEEWSACSRCGLAAHRRRVVFFKGVIPAKVLFVGEAPGISEDVIGYPFVGPAGQLFDRLREAVWFQYPLFTRQRLSWAATNIVSCIPIEPSECGSGVVRQPTKQEIMACQPKLLELVGMAKPKLIACLGEVAKRHLPLSLLPPTHPNLQYIPTVYLPHPAFILHQQDNPNQQQLAEKRFILALSAAIDRYVCRDEPRTFPLKLKLDE